MSGQSQGQRILDCLDLCDYRLNNDRDLAVLFESIDHILLHLAKGQHVK